MNPPPFLRGERVDLTPPHVDEEAMLPGLEPREDRIVLSARRADGRLVGIVALAALRWLEREGQLLWIDLGASLEEAEEALALARGYARDELALTSLAPPI